MRDYKSQVVSIRLDTELLEAIRTRAEVEGRSLSGQIVHFVRERVAAPPEQPRKPKPISGWLAHRPAIETLPEFQTARSALGNRLKRAVNEKAKRR